MLRSGGLKGKGEGKTPLRRLQDEDTDERIKKKRAGNRKERTTSIFQLCREEKGS